MTSEIEFQQRLPSRSSEGFYVVRASVVFGLCVEFFGSRVLEIVLLPCTSRVVLGASAFASRSRASKLSLEMR
jgi:hypothetical protein